MIDAKLADRLDGLALDRARLTSEAASYRLRAFDAIDMLAPQAARADTAIAVIRYVREHWALAATATTLVSLVLRRRIGMIALAQFALRLGSLLLYRR